MALVVWRAWVLLELDLKVLERSSLVMGLLWVMSMMEARDMDGLWISKLFFLLLVSGYLCLLI